MNKNYFQKLFTSPLYIKSNKDLMSTSGTSFSITIGCLSGCPTKSVCKNKVKHVDLNLTIYYIK